MGKLVAYLNYLCLGPNSNRRGANPEGFYKNCYLARLKNYQKFLNVVDMMALTKWAVLVGEIQGDAII
jgi:hypothetical protein